MNKRLEPHPLNPKPVPSKHTFVPCLANVLAFLLPPRRFESTLDFSSRQDVLNLPFLPLIFRAPPLTRVHIDPTLGVVSLVSKRFGGRRKASTCEPNPNEPSSTDNGDGSRSPMLSKWTTRPAQLHSGDAHTAHTHRQPHRTTHIAHTGQRPTGRAHPALDASREQEDDRGRQWGRAPKPNRSRDAANL
jgi:hypothetical protein